MNTNAGSDSGGDYAAPLTTDAAGNWVAVWYSYDSLGGTIGTEGDILVARSTDAGATWTAPAPLNTNAGSDAGTDSAPQVTTDAAGNWVAVWQSWDSLGGTIGTDTDILVSRSTDAGANWTAPAPLNANAGSDSGDDNSPELTTDAAGNWIAVWSSNNLGGTLGPDEDILVSRSTDAGANWTAPAPLNANAGSDSGDDNSPELTTDAAGNWIAAWRSDEPVSEIDTDKDILFATLALLHLDYGDAPSPYPTLLADIGAVHTVAGPRLGAYRDTELDGRPTANADGDDTTGWPDDEDGVVLPTLSVSTSSATTASLDIDLQDADATANYLDAWIDFNQDGDWADTGEQIFTSYNLGTTDGVQTRNFTIPQDTGDNVVYGTTYARFRLSTTGGLLPTGPANDGEVEDYQVAVTWFGPPEALNTNAGSDSGGDWAPQITTDAAGNWVAVWESSDSLGGTIGTDADILVSRSTDAGANWTLPEPLNNNAGSDTGVDWDPQITTDAAGNWVAVWSSNDSLDGTIGPDLDYDILVSRSTDAGATWSAPAPLNTNAGSDTGYDLYPQVTTDAAGNWVAVWESSDSLGGTIGTDMDILVSRSIDAGATWTALVGLNANDYWDSGDDNAPQVTTDAAGNWVAVWESADSLGGTIGTDWDILVSRSTDAGATWTFPMGLNTNAADPNLEYDGYSQVMTDTAGNWVAVWQSSDSLSGTIGTDYDILVSRSTDAGATWTAQAPLNSNADSDSGDDCDPQITTDAAGNWVAVWESPNNLGGTIGTDWDILVSRSTDAGANWTAPAPLNANAGLDSGWDWNPQVTIDAAGNWVAVWQSSDSLGGTIGTDVDILFATFSEVLNPVVEIRGTDEDDLFELVAGQTPGELIVKLNGVVQDVVNGTDSLVFIGLGGYDTVNLATLASNENDNAELWPDHGTFTSAGVTTTLTDVDSININGGTGEDSVIIHDSASDDILYARAAAAAQPVSLITMADTANSYSHQLDDFEILNAYSTSGIDTASLFDSDGPDKFISHPDANRLRDDDLSDSVVDFNFRVKDFQYNHAYAKNGGVDLAEFHDKDGQDDKFKGYPTYSKMFKGLYQRRAKFFENVVAYATPGDGDYARLFDSDQNDSLIASPTESRLFSSSAGYDIRALAFDSVLARAKYGFDTAEFIGGSGDDLLQAKYIDGVTNQRSPKTMMMDRGTNGGVYEITARKFDQISAHGGSGVRDIAKFWDTLGDDRFVAEGDRAAMYGPGNELIYDVLAFEQANINRVYGGSDTIEKNPPVNFDLIEN